MHGVICIPSDSKLFDGLNPEQRYNIYAYKPIRDLCLVYCIILNFTMWIWNAVDHGSSTICAQIQYKTSYMVSSIEIVTVS